MIAPAAPRVETSEAEKAKAKVADASRRRIRKARLLGFMAPSAKPRARRREPVLISPYAATSRRGRATPRKLDLAIDLTEANLRRDRPGGDFGRGLERIAARADL